MTVSPDDLNDSVVEGETEEDFPEQGKGNTLYYTDDGIYG